MKATGPVVPSINTTGRAASTMPSERISARPNRRARSGLPARPTISRVGRECWIAPNASRSSTVAERTTSDSSIQPTLSSRVRCVRSLAPADTSGCVKGVAVLTVRWDRVIRYQYRRDDDVSGDALNFVVLEISWRTGSQLRPPPTVQFDDREAGVAVYRLLGEEEDDRRP